MNMLLQTSTQKLGICRVRRLGLFQGTERILVMEQEVGKAAHVAY